MQWKKKSGLPWVEILFVLGIFPSVGGIILVLDQIATAQSPSSFSHPSKSWILLFIFFGLVMITPMIIKLFKPGEDKIRLNGNCGYFRMNPTDPDDFTIYLKNNSNEDIIIDRDSILSPSAWYIFI